VKTATIKFKKVNNSDTPKCLNTGVGTVLTIFVIKYATTVENIGKTKNIITTGFRDIP